MRRGRIQNGWEAQLKCTDCASLEVREAAPSGPWGAAHHDSSQLFFRCLSRLLPRQRMIPPYGLCSATNHFRKIVTCPVSQRCKIKMSSRGNVPRGQVKMCVQHAHSHCLIRSIRVWNSHLRDLLLYVKTFMFLLKTQSSPHVLGEEI